MNTATKLSLLQRTLIATALASLSTAALADIDGIKQRGKLVAGVSHVVPEYLAGTKFRTPGGMEKAIAEELAKRLQVTATFARAEPASRLQLLTTGKADVVLAIVAPNESAVGTTVVPTGYSAAPMAIMPTNTTIKTWEQLKGRPVCVSEKGLYAGKIAAKYGAVEKLFKAPADALLALRTGLCDAAVHDSMMLNELIRLPEWKKFSARLPEGPVTPLVFLLPASDATTGSFLKQVTSAWQANGFISQLATKTARQIAFEVYLDQDVPDCH